jgi:group I intron endonuclease
VPYANEFAGIYKIVNKANGTCYVGQSQRVNKRIREHFRLLRLNKHPNPRLQNAFNKYGRESFAWEIEAACDNPEDLDIIENAFLSGDAWFEEPVFYNIAAFAKAPMRNKQHSEEVRKRIRAGRRACGFDYQSEEYKATLSRAKHESLFSNPRFVAKVKFIVDNPDMSYAERARALGNDISAVRKLALKYGHLRGVL